MVDIFVLAVMSQPLHVSGVEHFVAWDAELNRAVIMYMREHDDGVDLTQLPDDNDNEMSFGTELDAYRYLIGLKVEKDDFDPKDTTWTTIR